MAAKNQIILVLKKEAKSKKTIVVGVASNYLESYRMIQNEGRLRISGKLATYQRLTQALKNNGVAFVFQMNESNKIMQTFTVSKTNTNTIMNQAI